MSRSDPTASTPPPEVLAIAVALAVLLPGGPAAGTGEVTVTAEPTRWRWAGERWARAASHRWS